MRSNVDRVKDVFEAYSASSDNPEQLESHQLLKLMKDYELYSDKVTQVTVQLLFTKGSKQKNCSKSMPLSG